MLNLLGNFSWGVGDFALAQGYYEQSRQLCREVHSRLDEAAALANLGLVLREQGDYEQTSTYSEQGPRLLIMLGIKFAQKHQPKQPEQ
jgi:tetratricopeptide (TPR) repeat protein